MLIPVLAILAVNMWTSGWSALKARGRMVISVSGMAAALLVLNWCLELGRDGPVLLRMLGPLGNQLYLPY